MEKGSGKKCEQGDKLVAFWHTHPSRLRIVTSLMKRIHKLDKKKIIYYWGASDSFSEKDFDSVAGKGSKPFYVTYRDVDSANQGHFHTALVKPGKRSGSVVVKTKADVEWVDLEGHQP